MRNLHSFAFTVLLLLFIAIGCNSAETSQNVNDSVPDSVADTVPAPPEPILLHHLRLPSGWTMDVTKPMMDTVANTYGDDFGIMIDMNSMLFVEYHFGIDKSDIRPCDSLSNASFASGFADRWNEEYPFGTLHTMDVDSVGTRLGVFASPLVNGEGSFDMEVSDCKTGAWIRFSQPTATAEQQKLLLVMFATLDYNPEK